MPAEVLEAIALVPQLQSSVQTRPADAGECDERERQAGRLRDGVLRIRPVDLVVLVLRNVERWVVEVVGLEKAAREAAATGAEGGVGVDEHLVEEVLVPRRRCRDRQVDPAAEQASQIGTEIYPASGVRVPSTQPGVATVVGEPEDRVPGVGLDPAGASPEVSPDVAVLAVVPVAVQPQGGTDGVTDATRDADLAALGVVERPLLATRPGRRVRARVDADLEHVVAALVGRDDAPAGRLVAIRHPVEIGHARQDRCRLGAQGAEAGGRAGDQHGKELLHGN